MPKKPVKKKTSASKKLIYPDLQLAAIVGPEPLLFVDLSKKLKKYINDYQLQDAEFRQPVQADDKLAVIVGSKPLPRTEIAKKLWEYIWMNNLQNPEDKTLIDADSVLKAVFNGKKQVTLLEMVGFVTDHIVK